MILGRRHFLTGALALAACPAWGEERFPLKVASNQGTENAALQQMLSDSGFARRLSLDIQLVESRNVSGPMESLLSGDADICMISAFAGILPAIVQGKPLRLVDAAMRLPALAVYSARSDLRKLEDLRGRTVGVGPVHGLLHVLMLALLRKKGMDPATVSFVSIGSNTQVLEAVATGKVDAGISGVAGTAGSARVLEDGRLWVELPEYTYELSYASVQALKDKPEALARCVAAYRRLYRYLSSPRSEADYLDARRRVSGESSVEEGKAVWRFIQQSHPYASGPGLSAERVEYLQQLNTALGIQTEVLPVNQVVDPVPAQRAIKLLARMGYEKAAGAGRQG